MDGARLAEYRKPAQKTHHPFPAHTRRQMFRPREQGLIFEIQRSASAISPGRCAASPPANGLFTRL